PDSVPVPRGSLVVVLRDDVDRHAGRRREDRRQADYRCRWSERLCQVDNSQRAAIQLVDKLREDATHLFSPGGFAPAVPPTRALAGTPSIPAPLAWLTRCARSRSPGGLRPRGPPDTRARGDPFDPRSACVAHSLRSFALTRGASPLRLPDTRARGDPFDPRPPRAAHSLRSFATQHAGVFAG